MASTKSVKVPTIDFSNHQALKPNTPLWESTKIQVFEALQEYDCFEAIYKVPNEIKDGMFGISKEIFEFPLETKLKNFSEKPLHGYMGMIPHLPLYCMRVYLFLICLILKVLKLLLISFGLMVITISVI
ncbi:hypothetical protein RDI58_004332 [Solanum bulbocastanum]|uniref:Non-haem dioxygenase N-terminal domain-containing protein n=1 Tax=Solanum bulbocastanum TaxID=147425 RepID=A0AAN8YLK5_SOLBU